MIIEGQGVHSGEISQVELIKKNNGGFGIFIKNNNGLIEEFLRIGKSYDFNLNANNSTIIEKNNKQISTIEHLFATFFLFPNANVDIIVKGTEIPILDGSSSPWLAVLITLCGKMSIPKYDHNDYPDYSWSNERSSIQVESSESFSVDYSLDLDGLLHEYSFDSNNIDDWFKILSARTFIKQDHFELGIKEGILKGAKDGTGILYKISINDDSTKKINLISGSPLRNENEFIFHKILDLLGDLAILGNKLPKKHFKIVNGGHWLNHKYLKKCQILADG